VFLGDDLLPWMVCALGAALLVGNVLAIVKPPAQVQEGRLERAPVVRSLVMAGIGLIALIWGAGSLIAG
jgi:hypothetical protein